MDLQVNPPAIVAEAPEQHDRIIVHGRRIDPLSLDDLVPELTLTAEDIESGLYFSIGEVLDDIPQTGAPRRRVFLVNGRPGVNPRVFRNFPADAIDQIDIMPIEASLRLGFGLDEQVVDITLKPDFRGWSASMIAQTATHGEPTKTGGSGNHSRIAGDALAYIGLAIDQQNALFEGDRDFADVGGVRENRRSRTLVPEKQSATVSTGGSRNIYGIGFSAFGEFERTRSEQVLGVVQTAAGDALLTRRTDAERIDVQLDYRTTLHPIIVHGDVGYRWSDQRTLTLEADGARSILRETRSDVSAFDANARLSTAQMQFDYMNVAPFLLVTAETENRRSQAAADTSFTQTRLVAQPNISAQIWDADDDPRRGFGFVDGQVSGEITAQSGRANGVSLQFRTSWRPRSWVALGGVVARTASPPASEALEAPRTETENLTVFDFLTGETATVTGVTGGNRDLDTTVEQIRSASIDFRFRNSPLALIGVSYTQTRTENPRGSINAPLPALETAFPERFLRDAQNRLVQIDQRAINFFKESEDELSVRLQINRAFSENAPPPLRNGRIAFKMSHAQRLRREIVLAPGAEAIDLLGGAAVSQAQSPSLTTMNINYFRRPFRLTVNARRSQEFRIDNPANTTSLKFDPLMTTDIVVTADLESLFGSNFRGTRARLNVDNTFDQKQRVTDENGLTPFPFSQSFLDPLGRTIMITLERRL